MKQERIYKRYFQGKTAFVLMVCILILAAATVSGTIAYLIEESGSVNNDFTYGVVSCRVTEKFDGRVKENAAIRNTGNTPAYIRARVNVSWKDGQGRVYGEPVSTSAYTMQFNTADWMEKEGFFYCRNWCRRNDSCADPKMCTDAAGRGPGERLQSFGGDPGRCRSEQSVSCSFTGVGGNSRCRWHAAGVLIRRDEP